MCGTTTPGLYSTQRNCKYVDGTGTVPVGTFLHNVAGNVVPAGVYYFRLRASGAVDSFAGNGHDFMTRSVAHRTSSSTDCTTIRSSRSR